MRTIMLRGSALVVMLLALSAPAAAQSLVMGKVLDAKNQPVEGALVQFEAIEFVNKRDVKTDKKGEFLFQGLQSGDYKVTASKDGLSEEQKTTISLTQKANLTFILQPRTVTVKVPAAAAPTGPPALEAVGAGGAAAAKDTEAAAVQALAASALESIKAGRHEEAVTRLNEVIGKLPNCADCYTYLGASLFELKKMDEAEAALKKAVSITPSVEGYTALTRLYNVQKKYDLAAEASQKASEIAAAPAPAPAGTGGAAPGAPAAAGAAPAAAPSASSETLYNQGVVLWNAQKYPEAKAQFEAAVKANPNNSAAQYQLGMANLNLGQIPAARAAFEAYLKVDPNGARAAEVKGYLTQLPK